MKIEPSSAATLSAIIDNDLASIHSLDAQLREIPLPENETSFRDLAAVAYILHNIYNALENSFEHISREFENNVKNIAQWHKELLNKMFLEIPGYRPAIFPPNCRSLLNDLRGFRHVFRHSYDTELDCSRLQALVSRWQKERQLIIESLQQFSQQLKKQSLES